MPSLWDLRRTWRRHVRGLSAVRGFHFATLGRKETKGRFTGEVSIKVYVREKLSDRDAARLPSDARVPKELPVEGRGGGAAGSVSTDVCPAPDPLEGFGIRAGHAVLGFDFDRGVCALSFFASAGRYLLTNAHVVADVRAGGVHGDVAVRDRTTGQSHVVGRVAYATPLRANAAAEADIAIVAVDPRFRIDDFMLLDTAVPIDRGRFDGLRSAQPTEYSYNVSGAVFRAAFAEPVVGFAPVRIDGVIVNYARCWLLHMTQGVGVPGHSGALLYRIIGGEARACGLVFAGSSASRTLLAYPFGPVAATIERVLGTSIS